MSLRSMGHMGLSAAAVVTGAYVARENSLPRSAVTTTATRYLGNGALSSQEPLPSHLIPWRQRYPNGIIHLYPRDEGDGAPSAARSTSKERCFEVQDNIAGTLTTTQECPFEGSASVTELLYERVVTVHPPQEERELFDFVVENIKPSVQQSMEGRALSLFQLLIQQGITNHDLERMFEATPDALFSHIPKRNDDQGGNREALEEITSAWRELAALPAGELESLSEDLKTRVFGGLKSPRDRLYFGESVATMLGYRAIGPGWVKFSRDPSTADSAMARMTADRVVAAIGTQFPNRSKDDVGPNPYPLPLVFALETQQQVPVGETPSTPGMPPRRFSPTSYPAKAMVEGYSMRAHVSGSAPLTMTALGLRQPWSQREVKNAVGVLECIYLHGDFHTPLETAAGVVHFAKMQGMPLMDQQDRLLEDLNPREFRSFAMDCARDVVDPERLSEFDQRLEKADRELASRAADLQEVSRWVHP